MSQLNIDELLDKALKPALVKMPENATAEEKKLIENWNSGQIARYEEFVKKIVD